MSNITGRVRRAVPIWVGPAGACCALVAYQWLAHEALDGGGWLAVATVLVPLAALVVAAWRTRLRVVVALGAVAAAAVLVRWPAGAPLAAALVHVSVYLGLFGWFAGTLRPQATPLVTRVAQSVRGALAPELIVYTRRVTQAWCMFFAGMAATSAALFLLAPLPTWSMFANVLNLPLVAVMFVGEYAWRLIRFRHLRRPSILAVLRASARIRDQAPHR